MKKTLLLSLLLMAGALGAQTIERPEALMQGKQLVVTTTGGQTYHYVVSQLDSPMLHRLGEQIAVQGDTFLISEVKSLRFRPMRHFVLNEDSTSFGANYAVDHGLLAFRRTLNLGAWNSVTVPFNLTGEQVRQAFGQDARLAQASKMREGGEDAFEFATVDLHTPAVALKAGSHYLLWPTRQPDVPAGEQLSSSWSADRVEGPVYLLPTVSLKVNQAKPSPQNLYGAGSQHVYINGTYYRLDGTYKVGVLTKNRKVSPGAYTFNDDGLAVQHADSTILPAFRSWFQNLSTPAGSLHFYVDGISDDLLATGIEPVIAQRQAASAAVYDLQGRRLPREATLRKGIYIVGGKKQIVK
ncbi:MAG: hypothetical protein IJ841_01805 [Prevotella sp.]|nr:hypothetical protein [Prevotella sp.]